MDLARTLHDEPPETIPVPHVDDKPHKIIRVLHVDDDTNQLIFMKRFLKEINLSIQVESIASPREALSKVSAFDCVRARSGVNIFYKNDIHGKILVVDDDSVAVVSSLNYLQNPALGVTWEAGIVTIDSLVISQILESIKNFNFTE